METREDIVRKNQQNLSNISMNVVVKGGFNLIPGRFYEKREAEKRHKDINIYSISFIIFFISIILGATVWKFYLKLQMIDKAEAVAQKYNEAASFRNVEMEARDVERRLDAVEGIEFASNDVLSFMESMEKSTNVEYKLKSISVKEEITATVVVSSVDDAIKLLSDLKKSNRFDSLLFLELRK